MNISLRRGERIFINGAVLRVDRKVSLELLNDVTFLLESHVMQVEQATTPLKRLYFVIQTVLMSPQNSATTLQLCQEMLVDLIAHTSELQIACGLEAALRHLGEERAFDALKSVRSLFQIEERRTARAGADESRNVA